MTTPATPNRPAPGGPGIEPRWTRGAKEAVGTAYSTASHVWYTIAAGILTEVYYPTIDRPQIRDLQYLVTDGQTFFHDERRDTRSSVDCADDAALGFEIVNVASNHQYTIRKVVIGHPHLDCVLVRTQFEAEAAMLGRLQLYALCAPHLEIGGWHNNAEVLETTGRRIFVGFKGSTWMALGASASFLRCSCGFVGVNDGWTDLHDNFALDWEYDAAYDGNIALTGQIDLSRGTTFTLALAFGDTRHRAITNLVQSLVTPFDAMLQRFRDEWRRTAKRFTLVRDLMDPAATRQFERGVNLLLAHEDKSYPGAMIASLSIPWGSSKGDEELGGYHLVWTRDLVKSATALLASGDPVTALRAVVYLAVSQREDGGFFQNFWLDGRPYWSGVQLDEVSFPLVLVWRLKQIDALGDFDPATMVTGACGFLMKEGPATAQERWEEAAGYSPSTLAINIAALVCAADLMRAAGDAETERFILEYADFLESHVEAWTVTTEGSLIAGVPRHYIRINPNTEGSEDPNTGTIVLPNQPPEGRHEYPAKEIVDAGFLELVRYGVRDPHDPIVEESVRVVDAVLRVETPHGPCWRRYPHDGYGQRPDGSAFRNWGVGRLWPLLTGERGHYELAAGRDAKPFLRTIEKLAVGIGLIPEQVWDQAPIPRKLLRFGGATGAAIPLAWAHAEYLTLARSVADNRVFDLIEPVRQRYAGARPRAAASAGGPTEGPVEIWSHKRPVGRLAAGHRLRIIVSERFILRVGFSALAPAPPGVPGEADVQATATKLGVWYADIPAGNPGATITFTIYLSEQNRWDDRQHAVQVVAD